MEKIHQKPLNPKVVLGVAAHPDDLDFGAAGTMAKYAEQGAAVHYLIVTDGSKGSEDKSMSPKKLAEIRRQEQRVALNILGGKSVTFLDYVDGEVEVTMGLKQDISRELRRLKPDVVITIDPLMIYDSTMGFINHPDHRAVGQATLDAVFPLARDHMSFPGLIEEGYYPHKTATVLLLNFAGDKCNYFEDVTNTFDKKQAALFAHKSQISNPEATNERIKQLAIKHGKKVGYTLAEPYIRIDIR
jgi:LmbE family N-acetylglucosaminyl deacetylase